MCIQLLLVAEVLEGSNAKEKEDLYLSIYMAMKEIVFPVELIVEDCRGVQQLCFYRMPEWLAGNSTQRKRTIENLRADLGDIGENHINESSIVFPVEMRVEHEAGVISYLFYHLPLNWKGCLETYPCLPLGK